MTIDRDKIRRKFESLRPVLNERQRRLWAAAEAEALGRGGVTAVSVATGIARSTIQNGREDLRKGGPFDIGRVRREGAGAPRREDKDPGLIPALEKLVDSSSRGDPESPLRWTTKSTRALARELSTLRGKISPQKVGRLLRGLGYSLLALSKTKEGTSHPDRNAQFEFIDQRAKELIERGQPVISVDSKKKELVGEFKTAGREWRPKGQPVRVHTHDFVDRGEGKAIPYGVYDIADNSGAVNVGIDHDTPAFAVHSIDIWWQEVGLKRYPEATELFITADAGGSNGYRARAWKAHLQRLADRLGILIHVSHFPPGTSKWNKIEHRLFSFITLNWRGRPLTSFETIIKLISSTRTAKGLRVVAHLDKEAYPLGEKITNAEMQTLSLVPAAFHGDWNYSLHPRLEADQPPPPKPPKHTNTRHARWRAQQLKVEASGLSLAEYCRREGLSYDALRTRRCRLKALDRK